MFRPTQDYILVKPLARQHSSILEVVSYEKYSRGLVIAAGPGKCLTMYGHETDRIAPLDVKVGDYITYGQANGSLDNLWPSYEESGETYRILQEADICFISLPEYIDIHNKMTDSEVEALIALHNKPLGLAA